MKASILIIPVILLFAGCSPSESKEEIKKEIFQTEKAFEKMTSEKGVAEAFYYFADKDAVIKRENDTLITGSDNIKIYYEKKGLKDAIVTWTPDFIDVSESGDLGYTYGKYTWKLNDKARVISWNIRVSFTRFGKGRRIIAGNMFGINNLNTPFLAGACFIF